MLNGKIRGWKTIDKDKLITKEVYKPAIILILDREQSSNPLTKGIISIEVLQNNDFNNVRGYKYIIAYRLLQRIPE